MWWWVGWSQRPQHLAVSRGLPTAIDRIAVREWPSAMVAMAVCEVGWSLWPRPRWVGAFTMEVPQCILPRRTATSRWWVG